MGRTTTRRAYRTTATISGLRFDLDRETVVSALDGELPEPIQAHYVVVDGRRYPPKQVLALVTGLDRADFTTHHARRLLLRLGFSAARRSAAPTSGANAAAAVSPYAEALRPYVGQWVATAGDEVLVGAKGPQEVVSWLTRHGRQADSMFRVPEGEAAAGGVAPL